MRGSDYADLRAFAAIAAEGSFARAAARLGVSPSALSQTMRGLEERLGLRLLNRTTRSVAPSEAGARLLSRLLPALADLDAAVADVLTLRDKPSGSLRLNASRLAALQCLAPIAAPFLAAYPDVTLDIVIDDRLVDIVAEHFDAGIRLGEMVEKDMVAVRLGGDMEMMIVAAPSYVERFGAPRTPRELRHHRCINFRWPTDMSVYRWQFERGHEKLEVAVEGPLFVTEPAIAARAATDGLGIAYLFDYYARPLLQAGDLVRLLEEWTPPFPGFYLYYPSRRQLPLPLRAFIEFVRTGGRPPGKQRAA
jgi:DNA-binding transcriptional LysR family regulator